MKKVIALRGCSNIGKSNTIKKSYELLSTKYPNAGKDHEISDVDIRVILTIHGVKVGIESQGDPGGRLAKSLRLFVNFGCKVIVCATRTRGQTVDAVNELESSYEILWIEQISVKISDQESSNLGMAKRIVKEIADILHS